MRATTLLIASGTTLGFTSADVVCNTEALHHITQVISDTTNEGLEKSVKDLCSSRNIKGISKDQFGPIILGLNRTCSNCNSNDCVQHFKSIIKECITSQELAGGIATTNGMIVEVSIDISLSDAPKLKALGTRGVRKAKSRTKTKTQPKKTKTEPKPKKPETKPKKTKSKACPIKDKKTPSKKGSKYGLRSLISTLFPRADSSASECEEFDVDMYQPIGWGETYFGFTSEGTYLATPMTKKKLLALARKAWDQANRLRPESLLLVAALYVPNRGVYFGTIPHRGGEDKFRVECQSFTKLWNEFLC